uniref:RNA-directed RNA polymerase n=1 Tax=Leviviridae sp. TaxID=2027243 RepID=A0A514D3Y5_9VIRU|nr:MAG: hypothetical protein H4Bulk474689_000001 [Leviviridae sp.]
MGNGFTFELESLIFWALCSSVVSHLGGSESDVAVYGDDIVVPVDCVDECVRLLEFCGFTLNMDKSFWRGSFRESCGMHYFKGHDVTPLYVKDRVDDQDRKVWLCNSIKLLAHRLNGHGWGLDGQLRSSYETVRLSLPSWLQVPRIPHTMGHGALWGDFDEVAPRRAKHQLDGWEVQFVTRVFKQRVCSGVSVLIKSLWGLRKEPPRLLSFDEDGLVKSIPDGVDLTRIPLVKFRRIRVKGFAARWESLGPWLESLSTS